MRFFDCVATVVRWLIVVIIIGLMWFFAVQAVRGQSVPLVRAVHDSFVSYYDVQTHNPALVVYQLEAKHFSGSNKVKGRHFKADTQLPRPRLKDSDYTNSGYVRGHLCSAGDRDSDKAWLKETYLTSNLVPMTMVCNSGPFKAIEDSCRGLALRGHRLQLARGPLYDAIVWPKEVVIHTRARLTIPAGFFCAGRCVDCGLRRFWWCKNVGTNVLQDVIQSLSGDSSVVKQRRSGEASDVIQVGCGEASDVLRFMNDPRVSLLLSNIIGLWSQEEYETITR